MNFFLFPLTLDLWTPLAVFEALTFASKRGKPPKPPLLLLQKQGAKGKSKGKAREKQEKSKRKARENFKNL